VFLNGFEAEAGSKAITISMEGQVVVAVLNQFINYAEIACHLSIEHVGQIASCPFEL